MQLTINSRTKLNHGGTIPLLGLGMYQISEGKAAETAVITALEAGYRHIDTAKLYGNEKSVGNGIRRAGVPREEVFVTTKLWNSDHGYDSTMAACEESLSRFGFDYVDLFLIHWPVPEKRLQSWEAMQVLHEKGKCRAIGVSNYMVHHLEELLQHSAVRPAVNQIELSPYNYRSRQEVIEFCRKNDIVVEAYSPLTKGHKLRDPKLQEIAQNYGKSTAQILIRWALQRQFVAIPKSGKPDHIRSNADIFDFSISESDMEALDGFDQNLVTSWDPTGEP